MEEKRKDKELYNYKTALEQPTWIQKLTERYSLPNAVKLSSVVWFLFLLVLFLYLSFKISSVTFLPFPLLLVFVVAGAWSLSLILSSLRIEGKGMVRFFFDYGRFYWKYGRKRKKMYVNDGFLYHKPSYILRKGVRRKWR